MWELHAAYDAQYYPTLDTVIRTALRQAKIRVSDDSGIGFGRRDLYFRFRTKARAYTARAVVRAADPRISTAVDKCVTY